MRSNGFAFGDFYFVFLERVACSASEEEGGYCFLNGSMLYILLQKKVHSNFQKTKNKKQTKRKQGGK